MKVRLVQTVEEVEHAYPCATESPIPFWAEALPLCRHWFAENLGTHIHGLHLDDENGQVVGHLYWAYSNQALAPYVIEDGAVYLYCNWVQRHYRGKGGMRLLFQTWVDSLNAQGCKGILVDGTDIEDYMHYRHFLKLGFRVMRESDGGKLLYYPLHQDSVTVEAISPKITPKSGDGVEILVIGSCFCPVGASALMAVRKIAAEYGDRVILKEIPASRETLAFYGVADGIFINGKAKFFGPVRECHVRKAIEEELPKI